MLAVIVGEELLISCNYAGEVRLPLLERVPN